MKETSNYSSSLSYFTREPGKIHLQFSPVDAHESAGEYPPFPFKLINSGDPLAHLFCGAVVTDFGSIIKEVNFLIQRDLLSLPEGTGTFLTNSIIEEYWQRAMLIRSKRAPQHSLMLAQQVDEQRLIPFAPLFYCQKRSIFFEPPCPTCGSNLLLCKNDNQLTQAELSPYTTTLKRYLHCHECSQTDTEKLWYTVEKGENEPTSVLDRKQLISSFRLLMSNNNGSIHFPCSSCPRNSNCYGPEQQAGKVISIISFFPFYMLITERDCLDGFHFLNLEREQQTIAMKSIEQPNSETIPESLATPIEREEKTDDPEIFTLLHNLAFKWQREEQQEGPQETQQKLEPAPSQTFTETFTLGAENNPPSTSPASSSAAYTDGDFGSSDVTTETVLITPRQNSPSQEDREQLNETVLLSAGSPPPETQKRSEKDEESEQGNPKDKEVDLNETIILRPDQKI